MAKRALKTQGGVSDFLAYRAHRILDKSWPVHIEIMSIEALVDSRNRPANVVNFLDWLKRKVEAANG